MTFGRISEKLPEAEEKENVFQEDKGEQFAVAWTEGQRVNGWEDYWTIGQRQL